jgi:hypothetical protein
VCVSRKVFSEAFLGRRVKEWRDGDLKSRDWEVRAVSAMEGACDFVGVEAVVECLELDLANHGLESEKRGMPEVTADLVFVYA